MAAGWLELRLEVFEDHIVDHSGQDRGDESQMLSEVSFPLSCWSPKLFVRDFPSSAMSLRQGLEGLGQALWLLHRNC